MAAALERAGTSARSRGGHASAARALERAAQFTPEAEVRAARLLAAAENSWRTGDIAATNRLLGQATTLTEDPIVLADVELLRGRVGYTHGSATDSYQRLLEGAAAVEAVAPAKAAAMLAEACWIFFGAAELGPALHAAGEAMRIARGVGGNVELTAIVAMAETLVLHGRTREARPLLARWKEAVEEDGYGLAFLPFNPTIGAVYLTIEDYEFARSLVATFHASARSAPELLPHVLACRTLFEYRTGDWASAYAHGTEGAQVGAAVRAKSSSTGSSWRTWRSSRPDSGSKPRASMLARSARWSRTPAIERS